MSDNKSFTTDFTLDSATIQPVGWDKPKLITDAVLNFNYWERIDLPTVSGEIMLRDNAENMISTLPIQGNEEIVIKLTAAVDNTQRTYKFRVFKIFSRYSTDRFQTYKLGLVSEEALRNEATKVGLVLKGTPSEIVSKMISEYIGSDKPLNADDSINKIKIQPGKKTPFAIIESMRMKSVAQKSRTSNTKGSFGSLSLDQTSNSDIASTKDHEKQIHGSTGFFFYENREGYNFRSMNELMNPQTEPVATYVQSASSGLGDEDAALKITNLDFTREIDLLSKLRMGAYSSVIVFYDYSTGKYDEMAYNTAEQYNKMQHLGTQTELSPGQKELAQNPTRVMSVLMDNETWFDEPDEPGTPDPEDNPNGKGSPFPDWQKHYMAQSIARLQTVDNQQLKITVPANPVLKIGDIINVKIPNQEVPQVRKTKQWDPEHSGNYLIAKVNHSFNVKSPMAETFLTLIRDSYGAGVQSNFGT